MKSIIIVSNVLPLRSESFFLIGNIQEGKQLPDISADTMHTEKYGYFKKKLYSFISCGE